MTKIKKIITTLSFIAFTSSAFASGILNNAGYEVCFTPKGRCTNLIVDSINKSKYSINVQAYGFTSAPIIKSLLAAKKRGVMVFVLLDKSNATSKYSGATTLKNNGIPFLIDNKPAIAHNKVMIIDGKTTITGSFNFTKSAQSRNAENVLIINDYSLARQYLNNFNVRKKASENIDKYCARSTKCKISRWTDSATKSTEKAASSLWESTKSISQNAWENGKKMINGGE